MAEVYTAAWYEEIREALNARVARLRRPPPDGGWTAAVEITSDGVSPYVSAGEVRRMLVRIEDGYCPWYREVDGEDDDEDLDYRFRGPGCAFDEIVAGLLDPVDAALKGRVRVTGDMRFLMRHADLVKELLEAFVEGVDTSWPHGRPPYDRAEEQVGA